MKRYLSFFIKIIVAAGLMTWLVTSGKMDFALIQKSFSEYPDRWLLSFVALFIMELIVVYRWKLILDIKSTKPISYFEVCKLTWIGIFFNPILPGAVSGDAVKIYYAKDLDPELTPSYLVTSVFFDRIIGLTGLMTMMGIFMVFNWQNPFAFDQDVQALMLTNIFLIIGVICFLVFIFSSEIYRTIFQKIFSKIPFVGKFIIKILDSLWVVGANKKIVIKTLLCSMITQSFGMFVFWYLTSPYYDIPLSFNEFYTVVPVGFITISIPITPMGIGLGNAVFDKLFAIYGISGGASLFNFKLLIMITFYMTGSIPYILHKKKFNIDDLEKVSHAS